MLNDTDSDTAASLCGADGVPHATAAANIACERTKLMNSNNDTLYTFLLGAVAVIPLELVVIFLLWVPYHLIRKYRERPKSGWIARA
jgi:hypothetical protein